MMPDQTSQELAHPPQPEQSTENQIVQKKRKLHPKLLKFVLLPLLGMFLLAALLGKVFLSSPYERPLAVLAGPTPQVQEHIRDTPTVLPTKASLPILASINHHGGLCRTGNECSQTVTIQTDKTILVNGSTKGMLADAEFIALNKYIANANFQKIKAKKFTGDCPTAYDGTEAIYTITTEKGIEVIKSCETAIDKNDPLFSTMETLFSQAL